MVNAGRKSAAQLRSNAAAIPGARAPVPPDLEPEAAELWVEIVNRLPADWVVSENKVLLREYCRHAFYANQFAKQIEEANATLNVLHARSGQVAKGSRQERDRLKAIEEGLGRLYDLHKQHGYQTDRLVSLATKMRFTQQSRYFSDKAAVRSRTAAPTGPRPWQDWGYEDKGEGEQIN